MADETDAGLQKTGIVMNKKKCGTVKVKMLDILSVLYVTQRI